MKSLITIIIHKDVSDLKAELVKALEPHRLNEDNLDSIKGHHWDYWYFPESPNLIDTEIKKRFSEIEDDIFNNTSYVKNLPSNYVTSGIIDLSGRWIDIQDFGWKMMNEPGPENEEALRKWKDKQNKVFDGNSEHICIQIIIHN